MSKHITVKDSFLDSKEGDVYILEYGENKALVLKVVGNYDPWTEELRDLIIKP